jgi:hypothetical protein
MNHIRAGAALGASSVLLFAAWLAAMPRGGAERFRAGANALDARDEAGSVAAFKEMLAVIRGPRCMNCHSVGDFPRQGDDGHPHAMNVRRGPEGKGVTAEKCSTCHQDHNLEGQHLPPGAPNWHLPPRDMPMIWQGLTDRGICEQLKDPARNGHRSMDQIVEHFTTDKLVAWGWNPGPGRNAVPMSREEFAAKVKQWASKGAACPGE